MVATVAWGWTQVPGPSSALDATCAEGCTRTPRSSTFNPFAFCMASQVKETAGSRRTPGILTPSRSPGFHEAIGVKEGWGQLSGMTPFKAPGLTGRLWMTWTLRSFGDFFQHAAASSKSMG